MSSNYPAGSMRGSGIYSDDYTGVFFCSTCEADFDCEGSTDDWQTTAYADCPNCGEELEKELADPVADHWADYDPEK